MMNHESNVLPCPKRAFSDVLEGMVFKLFSGGKPPYPQGSLKEVTAFAHDECLSIDHLHLKSIKFIAIEKRSKHVWFISFEFTCLTRQLETWHPPRICSSTAPGRIRRFQRLNKQILVDQNIVVSSTFQKIFVGSTCYIQRNLVQLYATTP